MEIGQFVKWNIAGKTCYGIFRQLLEDKAEVNCLMAGNKPFAKRLEIDPDMLIEAKREEMTNRDYDYQTMNDRLDVLIYDSKKSIDDAYGILINEFGTDYFNRFLEEIRKSLNEAPIIIY